jgi:hypothetical protein
MVENIQEIEPVVKKEAAHPAIHEDPSQMKLEL